MAYAESGNRWVLPPNPKPPATNRDLCHAGRTDDSCSQRLNAVPEDLRIVNLTCDIMGSIIFYDEN